MPTLPLDKIRIASTKVSPELTVNCIDPVAAPPGAVAKTLILAAVLLAAPPELLPPIKLISWLPLDQVFFMLILLPSSSNIAAPPLTCSLSPGLVVPMPTLPSVLTAILVPPAS